MHPPDEANPYRRPLTLRDWHFVYGLPVTPKQYLASCANGGFAVFGGYRDWHEYELAFDGAKRVLDRFTSAGLNIAWGPRRGRFCRLLRRQNAVILLTHAAKATATQEGRLEFRGDMVPFRLIVSKVDPSFAGILEICACEADRIQEPLKRRAPGGVSKVWDRELTLGYWIKYYAEFLQLFTEVPTTYFDAIMRTAR